MAAKPDFPDVFMNFRTIAHVHHATDHTVLTESYIETGLEIRGGIGWLIHLVEVEWANRGFTTANICRWAVSTRRGQAAIPVYGDRGCLLKTGRGLQMTSSGASSADLVQRMPFRPPVILASRYLVSYFDMDADEGPLDGATSYIRIGYTTLKLAAADYIEVAETWGE